MSRQWLIPGGGFVDEDGDDEYLIPGDGFINEDQAAGVTTLNRLAATPVGYEAGYKTIEL